MLNNKSIFVVDDDESSIKNISDILSSRRCNVTEATNAQKAWNFLQKNNDIDVILLGHMMSAIDSMELLVKIKQQKNLKNIPVIMHAEEPTSEQLLEGIQAGAFYYLTKPFKNEILLAIVENAIEHNDLRKLSVNKLQEKKHAFGQMESSHFTFRTIDEAQSLSYLIADSFPNPEITVIGIIELMVNAIEHGNLAISYEEKKELLMKGAWKDEISNKLASDEFSNRYASVEFRRNKSEITLTISDEGKGFDWSSYMAISPQRATAPNGRGVAIANMLSFDELEYVGSGSKVIAKVRLN